MYACKNGCETLVKYLVEHGVNINEYDSRSSTALEYACQNGCETIIKY